MRAELKFLNHHLINAKRARLLSRAAMGVSAIVSQYVRYVRQIGKLSFRFVRVSCQAARSCGRFRAFE